MKYLLILPTFILLLSACGYQEATFEGQHLSFTYFGSREREPFSEEDLAEELVFLPGKKFRYQSIRDSGETLFNGVSETKGKYRAIIDNSKAGGGLHGTITFTPTNREISPITLGFSVNSAATLDLYKKNPNRKNRYYEKRKEKFIKLRHDLPNIHAH